MTVVISVGAGVSVVVSIGLVSSKKVAPAIAKSVILVKREYVDTMSPGS